jgi:hypothetical protein
MGTVPQRGNFVRVRSRRWLVEDERPVDGLKIGKDLEIGKPSNSDKWSETAEGVARESVSSCPRAGCGKSACPVR